MFLNKNLLSWLLDFVPTKIDLVLYLWTVTRRTKSFKISPAMSYSYEKLMYGPVLVHNLIFFFELFWVEFSLCYQNMQKLIQHRAFCLINFLYFQIKQPKCEYGSHFLCWISGVVPFNIWLISSWEKINCCYKLSKSTKWHLLQSK